MARPTLPLLRAMEEALAFRLAGELGEGVYEDGLTYVHYDRALDWVREQMRKRRKAHDLKVALTIARKGNRYV